MTNYINRTLVTRIINCSNLTADEFISAMFSDLLEAEEKYNDLYIPEYVASNISWFVNSKNSVIKNAINVASKKWKTDKKRKEYINKTVKEFVDNYNLSNYYNKLSFFDFDVNPGDMGISNDCVLSYKGLTPTKLERCFNKIKDNEYFKKASGWMLTYETTEDSYRSISRPEIKLIVDSETEDKMKNDAINLANSVAEFYKDCKYWGD